MMLSLFKIFIYALSKSRILKITVPFIIITYAYLWMTKDWFRAANPDIQQAVTQVFNENINTNIIIDYEINSLNSLLEKLKRSGSGIGQSHLVTSMSCTGNSKRYH